MPPLIATRAATSRYIVTFAALCMFFTPAAQAATSDDCSASDASLSCRLTGLLYWLDAAAVVLVLVLLAVLGIAIYLYRKNSADRTERR